MSERTRATGFFDIAARILLVLEALLAGFITTRYVVYAGFDESGTRFLWGAAVVSALLTVGVAIVAWGFIVGRRFALGGAFALQLFMGAAGVWLLGTMPVLGAAFILAALTVAFAVSRRVSAISQARQDP